MNRRVGIVLLALAVTAGAAPVGPGHAQESTPLGKAGPAPVRTVTLLTGDRIDVQQRHGQQVPRLHPGAGRDHVKFAVSRVKGHLYVIPADAIPLVRAGQLDRRLFDVTGLLALGYDDQHRKDLPLLVQGGSADAVAPLADDGGATVTRKLSSVDSVAVRQPKRTTGKFWSSATTRDRDYRAGISRIWLDGKRKALLDRSVPQVGAPTAWQAGYTGKGVKVAVLDTGIDASHPDFAGRIGGSQDFSGSGTVNDTVGHGTHVASTIAGTGAASGGKYRGVAPDATLLIGKVCGGVWCDESAILAGMQWAASSGARVANLSLGGGDTPEIDPLEQAVNDLTASHGTLFVIAAGNSGPGDETLGSPASADAALAVGAVDKDDKLADFSSRGPRVGDGALKPEITAPGVDIVAANAKDGFLGEPGQKYTTLSGTSMATPHVAGAAAILAQQHTDWKAGPLKSALVGSATTLPELGAYAQGAGRLDVGRAVKHPGYADPAVISAPLAMWPHDDDAPVTRTVTYHNPGSEPVTYQLGVTARGPDGQPAADGMFTLSRGQVTVPAGGTATVDVTVDTSVPSPDGYYSAWVTATAGEARLTTPVAVNKEPESYNLTIDLVDRTGKRAESYFGAVVGLETNRDAELFGNGREVVRLPKGRYHVFAFVQTDRDGGASELSLLTYPEYTVSGDSALTLDARQAKKVTVTLDRPEARQYFADVGYTHVYDRRLSVGAGIIADTFDGVSTKHLGPKLARDELITGIAGNWAVPGPGGALRTSTRTYNLAYYEYGELVTGYTKRESQANLAAVRATYHTQGAGKLGVKFWMPHPPGMRLGGTSSGILMPLPITRTEYHSVAGVEWDAELSLENADDVEGGLGGPVGRHKPGRVYPESWNPAVFGPSAAGSQVERDGDQLFVGIATYSDGAGHFGGSATDTARTVLYKDGRKVGESPYDGYGEFEVPADEGAYTLRVDATRSVSPFTTKMSCTWTFRSGHTAEPERVPLLTVGLSPKLDTYNRAKAGETQLVPVTVVGQPGAGKVKVRSLTVEVSYDDGKTWKKVRVTRGHPGDGWLARIAHPAGKKYVSVRTSAADKHGNTVKETLIRAYALK
ncbi:MAG: S8 family peptidase [Micromonosporaceae bacterium]